jgi:hypothetical protein
MSSTETSQTARFPAGHSLDCGGWRHRLYVVLPLFLALAIAGTSGRSTASVLQDATYTQSGSLVAGKGFITLDVAGFTLQGWNGAFEVDAGTESKLTLAALTTPILALRDGEAWLVPAGMQLTISTSEDTDADAFSDWMRTHRPLPLPAHYLRERLPDAEALLAHTTVPSLSQPAAVLPPLVDSSLQLETAKMESEKADHEQRLWVLGNALVHDDLETFDALLSDVQTIDALQKNTPRDLLTLAYPDKRDLQLLQYLLHDSVTATIVRFHPLTRDRVWLNADADHDLLLLAQLLQPLSDRSEASVSAVAVQAWQDGWKILSKNGALPADVLDAALPSLVKDIMALDSAGYPARARAYATALLSGLQPLRTTSATSREALERLRSVYDIAVAVTASLEEIPAEVTIQESGESSSQPERLIVAEADVRATLMAQGCMFTAQSTVQLRPDGLYDIAGVVIGTSSGDRLIGFTLDAAAGLVSGIEQDGKMLPYSMELTKYLGWVKQ